MSGDDSLDLIDALLGICEHVIKGTFTPEDGYKQIGEHCDREPMVSSAIVDVFSMMDAEEKDEEGKKRFTLLVNLVMKNIAPEECVRAELDSLDASTQANRLQIIRTKTKLFFKQSKFNLLREESEGYAKLITELLSIDDTIPTTVVTQRILSLIGTFSLDPNRALDILMESFERLPSKRGPFVEMLREMAATREYLQTYLVYKYSLYQNDKSETPFSLYRVTAALIQEGLIEMDEVVPFLTPTSSDLMESHKARAALASIRSKKAETILASMIAIDPHKNSSVGQDGQEVSQITGISFAAVTGVQEAEDAKLRGTDDELSILGLNQKVGVVTALLEAGEWERAKRVMDCMPEGYAVQTSKRAACAVAELVDATISDMYHLKCAQGLGEMANERKKREEEKERGEKSWDKRVSTWDDFDIVFELLSVVGPRVAYRSKTLTKLVRLTAVFFEEKTAGAYGTGPPLSNKMMDVIDEIILPGLSLSESNVGLSEEIWSLISQFPYELRFRLYGRWKTIHTTKHPEMMIERGKTIGRTKYVIKRLSKDTVKMMGRILGKLAHTHPSFVFDYLLTQVQTFDNLIHPVVDALRFLTNLELDVLLFCVLEQLASPSKESLKASDGTTSNWLMSLATMVGALLKKYPIELAGVLDYVGMQLRSNKSADLLILNEMLHSMAGVEKAAQATQEHIEALQGGEVLRSEAGNYGSAIRNKKAAMRLRDAILNDDLAVGLSILVAQQRDSILFEGSKDMPLKLTGEMADQCRDTLVQFVSFLLENMKLEEYARKMPPIDELITEYSVPVDAAFFLARPAFRYEVNTAFDRLKRAMRVKEKEAEAVRKEMEKEEGEKTEKGESEKEKEKKERRQMDAMVKMSLFNSAIDEVVTRLASKLEPVLKGMLKAEISAKTYILFWMLEAYDLEVPSAAYEREIEKIRKGISACGDGMESKTKRSREEDRLRTLESKLKEEQRHQSNHVERMRAYLRAEKENLYSQTPNAILTMLHTCLLPRAMFSESDAIYSAKFIHLMHQQQTSGFQTLFVTDKITADILPVVSLCSENEAQSLGRCLQMIMQQHAGWHDDAGSFEKECLNTAGFQMRLKKTPVGGKEEVTGKNGGNATHDVHAKLLFKWQGRVSRALQGALNNPAAEYVHLRNCIVVATKMLSCFPLMKLDADAMEKAAAALRDREKGRRDDLSLKAASYIVLLKTRKMPLRDPAYFGCKNPAPPPPATPAAPVASKSIGASGQPVAGIKKSAKTGAATASNSANSLNGGMKNGVKREVEDKEKKEERKEKEEKREERVIKKEIKSEPVEEGPSLPPPSSKGEEKGEERVKGKKRKEIELGGVAARTLLLGAGGKKARASVEGEGGKKEERNGRTSSLEKEREREIKKEEPSPVSTPSSSSEKKSRRKEERREGKGEREGKEGEEDGEVPPSPPVQKREEDRTKSGSNGSMDEKESRREKEERRDKEREERKREELKERMREREKKEREREVEKKRISVSASASEDRLMRNEKEREREKRKQLALVDENAPSLKKSRKEKEKEEKKEEKKSRRSPSRDDRSREKERRGKDGKERREEEKERSRLTSKRVHNEIRF